MQYFDVVKIKVIIHEAIHGKRQVNPGQFLVHDLLLSCMKLVNIFAIYFTENIMSCHMIGLCK